MPRVESESFPASQVTTVGRPAVIVLSTAGHLLYLNRRAIELVGLLDSTFPVRPRPATLPACLIDITDDVRAIQRETHADGSPSLYQINRFIGAASCRLYVQGFLMSNSRSEDERIVLVLARPDGFITS